MSNNFLFEEINWHYENVTSLARENTERAREIVKKNVKGVTELIKGNYSDKKKIIGLSDSDKEIAGSLFLLTYRDGTFRGKDGKTNKEFLEDLFSKSLENIVDGKDDLFKNIKSYIIDIKRRKAWEKTAKSKKSMSPKDLSAEKEKQRKETEEEDRKRAEELQAKQKEKEEEDNRKREALKKHAEEARRKEEVKKEQEKEPEQEEDEEPEKEAPSYTERKREYEDRTFDEAIEELERYKEEIEGKLKELLSTTHNERAINTQLSAIAFELEKRVKAMRKAREGLTANPKLRVNQELSAGKSFMNRALYTARSKISPNVLQRTGIALKDIGKGVKKEVKSAIEGGSKLYPARLARQVKQDYRANVVSKELGREAMEEFLYTKDKDVKEEIYKEALKARSARRAQEKRDKEKSTEQKPEEKKPNEQKANPQDNSQKKANKDIDIDISKLARYNPESKRRDMEKNKNTGRRNTMVSSTDLSHLPTLTEELKSKIKNSIK